MEYKIAVSWEVAGELRIEAESLEEAIKIAKEDDSIALPTDTEYIDGSFRVDDISSNCLNE